MMHAFKAGFLVKSACSPPPSPPHFHLFCPFNWLYWLLFFWRPAGGAVNGILMAPAAFLWEELLWNMREKHCRAAKTL